MMTGSYDRLTELFWLWYYNEANAAEVLELKALMEEASLSGHLDELTREMYDQLQEESFFSKEEQQMLVRRVLERSSIPKRRSFWNRTTGIAATLLLLIGLGGYFVVNKFYSRGNSEMVTAAKAMPADIAAPSQNKAELRTANGRIVSLDSVKSGVLSVQNGVKIIKQPDGRIVIEGQSSQKLAYNTISVPKGSKPVHLQLIDGTQVWLNVASGITFPTAFTGNERRISMTGEAYFEVVHDNNHLFKVIAHGQVIEDIGTHFNVNAYNDEPAIVTTLTEGKISILKNNKKVLLDPGQQAVVSSSNNNIKIRSVDIAQVLSWKNGYFQFDHTDLRTVLRELSRWYDVTVVYDNDNASIPKFSGKIHRDINLSEALEILKYTGVNFELQGRKLTVIQ